MTSAQEGNLPDPLGRNAFSLPGNAQPGPGHPQLPKSGPSSSNDDEMRADEDRSDSVPAAQLSISEIEAPTEKSGSSHLENDESSPAESLGRSQSFGWGRAIASFIYPPACLSCAVPFSSLPGAQSFGICRTCEDLIAPRVSPICLRCSAPVGPHLSTIQGCQLCRRERFAFTRAISLGVYDGLLQRFCLQSKQPGQRAMATALTDLLCERFSQELRSWPIDVILPVPHHWSSRLFTDHHASTSVAERIGQFLMKPVERHILLKVRRTKRQQSLPASARRENLRAVFRVSERTDLRGIGVLLTDDILTTGTTAHRATRALLEAGAERVYVAVLARGV